MVENVIDETLAKLSCILLVLDDVESLVKTGCSAFSNIVIFINRKIKIQILERNIELLFKGLEEQIHAWKDIYSLASDGIFLMETYFLVILN